MSDHKNPRSKAIAETKQAIGIPDSGYTKPVEKRTSLFSSKSFPLFGQLKERYRNGTGIEDHEMPDPLDGYQISEKNDVMGKVISNLTDRLTGGIFRFSKKVHTGHQKFNDMTAANNLNAHTIKSIVANKSKDPFADLEPLRKINAEHFQKLNSVSPVRKSSSGEGL